MVDETLSDEELDEIYRRMVDSFIDRANELAETNSAENVGMALLYAASRFNAHVVSQHSETRRTTRKICPARENFSVISISACSMKILKTTKAYSASTPISYDANRYLFDGRAGPAGRYGTLFPGVEAAVPRTSIQFGEQFHVLIKTRKIVFAGLQHVYESSYP